MRTAVLTLFLVAAAFGVVAFVVLQPSFSFQAGGGQGAGDTAKRRAPSVVLMLFAGDIMLSRKIGGIMKEKGDYRFHFLKIASTTLRADISFANLESPLSSRGTKSGSAYSFRAEPMAVEGLTFAGFDVLSVANNHLFDYGEKALRDTLSILSENDIAAIGAGETFQDAHAPRVMKVGRTRIAFLAYSNLSVPFLGRASSSPAIASFDDEILRGDIARAREIADTGVGIPAETIPHLFQKFSRADAEKMNFLGSGLGLYLAKIFVDAHHGRIWVESAGAGKGSAFYVELPV